MVRTRSSYLPQKDTTTYEEIKERKTSHDLSVAGSRDRPIVVEPSSSVAPSKRHKKGVKKTHNVPDSFTDLTPGESLNLIDKMALEKWPLFSARPVSMGKAVNLSDLTSYSLHPLFDALKLSYILSISTVSYPELVRLFYCNLRKISEGHLTSRVRGINIDLTPSTLAKIFHISSTGVNPMNISPFEALSLANATPFSNYNIAIRRDNTVSGPYHDVKQLNKRAQLIVQIIVSSLAPKDEHLHFIDSITKIFLAFIWQKHEFNFAEFIMDNMLSHVDSIYTLPYGMWLTSIFKFFSVQLDGEPFIPPGEPIKAITSLNTPQICSLNNKVTGTSEAWNPVPPFSSQASFSGQDLLVRLKNMETSLYNLQLDIASLKELILTQFATIQNEHADMIGKINALSGRTQSMPTTNLSEPRTRRGAAGDSP